MPDQLAPTAAKNTTVTSGDSPEWLHLQIHNAAFREMMLSLDWSQTEFGPLQTWPQSLRTAVSLMAHTQGPCIFLMGAKELVLYNDAYIPRMAARHPLAFGRKLEEIWPSLTSSHRDHARDDVLASISRSSLYSETGTLLGTLCFCRPLTIITPPSSVNERRLEIIRLLGSLASEYAVRTSSDTLQSCLKTFGNVLKDAPIDELSFIVLYEVSRDRSNCRTIGRSPDSETDHLPGIVYLQRDQEEGDESVSQHAGAEETTSTGADIVSVPNMATMKLLFTRALKQQVHLEEPVESANHVQTIPSSSSPSATATTSNDNIVQLIIYPFITHDDNTDASNVTSNLPQPDMLAVFGIPSHLAINESYLSFLDMATAQISNSIGTARLIERQRQRAEALVELDHAKNVFFSNCSHEFRTPLELIVGPVDEILLSNEVEKLALSQDIAEKLEMVRRNGNRLLKLINGLLQFSSFVGGKTRLHLSPTNFVSFTRDLVTHFESTARRFNLTLEIDSSPELECERVYIDKEMYSRVVLNLLSNAFKATFEGGVRVRLFIEEEENVEQVLIGHGGSIIGRDPARCVRFATLQIIDTGIGISMTHLPWIFDRFYTVENARNPRSTEGIGIGLNLANEIVKSHGGDIRVKSEDGKGSTFTARFPLGVDHIRALPSGSVTWEEDEEAANINEVVGEQNAVGALEYHNSVEMFVDEVFNWSQAPNDVTGPLEENILTASDFASYISMRTATTSPENSPTSVKSSSSYEGAMFLGADSDLLSSLIPEKLSSVIPRLANVRHRQSTVLLVDDNLDMLKFLTQVLVKANFYVITASNGIEALKIATKVKNVDVILTDKIMPVMDGLSLIRELRKNPKTLLIPIILLTVRAGAEESVDGLEAGADDYLTKPFLTRELVARVSVHCNLHRMRSSILKAVQEVQVLEAANDTKTKFLSLVSHEMRTPLFSIIGNVELLQFSNLSSEQREQISTIEFSSNTLLNLIQEVLDIGKLESSDNFSFEIDQFSPRAIVREISEAVSATTKMVRLSTYVHPAVPERASADSKRIRQVIEKILHNAIKFSDKEKMGATIQLRILLQEESAKEIDKDGEEVRRSAALYVEVGDNGIGMRSTERIFDPFWQAEIGSTRQYGGSGLGLTVAKQLVEKAGGNIGVESQFGVGSKLWFTWPIVIISSSSDEEQPSDSWTSSSSSSAQADQPKKKIRNTFLQKLRHPSFSPLSSTNLGSYLPIRRSPGGSRSPTKSPSTTPPIESPQTSYFQVENPSRSTSKRGSINSVQILDMEAVKTDSDASSNAPLPSPNLLPPRSRLQQIKILLAEDNPVNRQLMTKQLQRIGFKFVDLAVDGAEVLRLIGEKVAMGDLGTMGREGYNLILMDCDMPFVSGLEATIKIREMDHPVKDVPIIAVTANAYASDRQRCLDVGMSDFVSKPVNLEQLKVAIARWIS